MDENKELWNKCAAFHGHVCGGLTIGYKAALYASCFFRAILSVCKFAA